MIKILNEETINKIAAGEVIERPVNIVKELIENSIDANATRIVIKIAEGGIKNITVTDNGFGIDYNDMKSVFLSHATSKINNINDIYQISSYGFRGEALFSIGIASSAYIVSKTEKSNNAYKISNQYGVLSDVLISPGVDGTTVSINDLFNNMPVRKKFLKKNTVEASLIKDMIEKMALANPNISFKYVEDDIEKFSSSGDNNLRNIIYTLYGKEIYDNTFLINNNYNGIKINAIIGKPSLYRNNRNDEIFFVNKRYIKNDMIKKSVESAYKPYLLMHKFPLSIINIDILQDTIDVNVHPQKLEVRFTNENLVYEAIYNTIKNELEKSNLILNDGDYESNPMFITKKEDEEEIEISNIKSLSDYDDNNLQKTYKKENDERIYNKPYIENKKNNIENNNSKNNNSNNNEKNIPNIIFNDDKKLKSDILNNYKYVGQVFNTYIIIECKDKIYIIDQHAAHEKINYEKFLMQLNSGIVETQKIMPIILTLTTAEYETVTENMEYFKKAGFHIELFGDKDIIVDSVPLVILSIGRKELLMDMIDNFSKEKTLFGYDSINDKIASISCKTAIKGNTKLLDIEVKKLIEELFSLDNPYNCPHGRPTIVEMTEYDFQKKFKRVVN